MHFLYSLILLFGIIYTVTSAPELPDMGDNCKVGDTKMDKCNPCECKSGFEGSVWDCENEVCEEPTVDIGSQLLLSTGDSDNCKVGDTKMEKCNRCECKSGFEGPLWICKKVCEGDSVDIGSQLPPGHSYDKCFKGERLFDGCNWCNCIKDNVLACNRMACNKDARKPRPSDGFFLGEKVYDGCNWCGARENEWNTFIVGCTMNKCPE